MIAYSAILSLASAALHAAGYRARGEGHHATLFDALPLVIASEKEAASYFDRCRRKRNRMTYSAPKQVSEQETTELHEGAKEFLGRIEAWIVANHPDLAAAPPPSNP